MFIPAHGILPVSFFSAAPLHVIKSLPQAEWRIDADLHRPMRPRQLSQPVMAH